MKRVVCFHNPDEQNGYLSNWYRSEFEVNRVKFSSMEQYMMYSKALLFGDKVIAAQIMQTDDVAKIKALGRKVRGFNEQIWESNRVSVITEGLLAKFQQNPELRAKLIATGTDLLAECAVRVRIWGIGLCMKDERRFDTMQWNGLNLLGQSLMETPHFYKWGRMSR